MRAAATATNSPSETGECPVGARGYAPPVYGISTDTLKNRWAAFVGECHAASVKLSLPQMVYMRSVPFVFRFGDHVTCGTPSTNSIPAVNSDSEFVRPPQNSQFSH